MTIADTGSFSVAAERLFLTQPAISKRIRALESELGTRLFDRVGRQTLLTPAGELFYHRARIILQQLEDSRREIENLSGQVAGALHIGTSHHIGLHRLPPILKRVHQQYPELSLDIHFKDSEAVYHDVHTGKLELGVITIPVNADHELHTDTIWPDPLEFVVARSHPLARISSADNRVTARELTRYDAILPAKNTYTRQILESAFTQLGHDIKTALSTNYLETNKMLVTVGLGWSLLPRTMVGKKLTILSIPRMQLQRNLGVVRHPKRTLSNAAKIMVDLLNEAGGGSVGDRQ